MMIYHIHHNLTCEHCGADLTAPGAIEVSFSIGYRSTNTALSQVDKIGLLADVTHQISIGMHSGSECTECGELLDEI